MNTKTATVSAASLGEALAAVSHIVPRRTVLPVFGGVLISPGESGFTAMASNGRVWVRHLVLGAEWPRPLLMDAPLLNAMVQAAGDVELKLDVKPSFVQFTSVSGKWRLPRLGAGDFPQPEPPGGDTIMSVHADELAGAIKAGATMRAKEEYQNGLDNIYVDGLEKSTVVVGCSNEGLSMFALRAPCKTSFMLTPESAKAIATLGGVVELFHGDRTIEARSATTSVYCLRPYGDYPDYRRVYDVYSSSSRDALARVAVDDLIHAVKCITPFAGGEYPAINLRVVGPVMTLEGDYTEVGMAARQEVPCQEASGDSYIKLTPSLLLGLLRPISRREVELGFHPAGPCLLIKTPEVRGVVMGRT